MNRAKEEIAAPKFPEVETLINGIKSSCQYIISQSIIEYPENIRARAPIFHAHVYLDRREYLVSLVPTDLDGPDSR